MRLFLCAVVSLIARDEDHTVVRTLDVDGRRRTYRIHVPPTYAKDKPAAVVLAFHGGGTDGRTMERFSGFDPLSDKEGFLAVYPDGYERNWNDGRGAKKLKSHRENIDDVAFVSAILDALAKEYSIDEKRIFATGISNGAIFSHTLAAKLSKRISGIAPVAGGMAPKIAEEFKPERPVAVLIVQSTEDPLVPFEGGKITGPAGRDIGDHGSIVGTKDALQKWIAHNGCGEKSAEEKFPDRDPQDGCRATRSTWKGRATVSIISVDGGGHTWPGGRQYMDERLIGKVCRDFEGAELIWEFFKSNGR